jgi:DNA-binding transcriptional ArsR family regulator
MADGWAPVLRVLSHPDRLLIVLWLAECPASVRELEALTGLGQSLVSYHLAGLRDAGMVSVVAVGRSNRYELSWPQLDRLGSLLGELALPSAAGP